jgi:hypothetical protein
MRDMNTYKILVRKPLGQLSLPRREGDGKVKAMRL